MSKNFKSPYCGNIGVPPTSLIEDEDIDFLVCEISSYQAQMTEDFKPFISCWTNFTPDHIDWHDGLENYFNAKAKIFLGKQRPEYAILNASDENLAKFAKKCKNVVMFDKLVDTSSQPSPQGEGAASSCGIKDDAIWYGDEEIIKLEDCPLVGHHNYQNIMCGIICAKLCEMENEDIRKQIMSFKAPEHRLEKSGK